MGSKEAYRSIWIIFVNFWQGILRIPVRKRPLSERRAKATSDNVQNNFSTPDWQCSSVVELCGNEAVLVCGLWKFFPDTFEMVQFVSTDVTTFDAAGISSSFWLSRFIHHRPTNQPCDHIAEELNDLHILTLILLWLLQYHPELQLLWSKWELSSFDAGSWCNDRSDKVLFAAFLTC